ncbi:cyclic nucleotide-binding domain-containing protein, partial [Streptomyces vinaceus]
MKAADMSTAELRSALLGLEIFAGLTEDQLDWLVSVSEPRVLADGEVLFRDGEEASGFHVLLAGGLVVTKVVDGREEVLTRHSTEEESAAAEEHDGKPSAAHRFTGELPLLTDGSY